MKGDVSKQGKSAEIKNYKSSLISIFNAKQFLEMRTTGPMCATSSGSLISVLYPSTLLYFQGLGSNGIALRFRKFTQTQCHFSFEHAQLISQKALFCLSPFGREN